MNLSGSKLYWILQLSGWGIYVMAGILIQLIFTETFPNTNLTKYVGSHIFSFGLFVSSTHIIRSFILKYNWLNLPWTRLILNCLLITLLASVVTNLINSVFLVFVTELFTVDEYSFQVLGVYIFQVLIMYVLWTSIYVSIQYFRNYKMQEIEKWKLESAVKDAELIALKSQINPHFIFNSLNNIRSLVAEDAEKARDMITHLSMLLRYSIQFNDKELVKLADEIEIVKDYLTLESIQLEARLSYKISIPEDLQEVELPPMTVQLLVENAIKHGINTLPQGGEILVEAMLDKKQHVQLQVSNTGQIDTATSGTGVGLKNAANRLSLLHGKMSDLRVFNLDDHRVMATFTIPSKKP